jgi:tetratricopeptide (TPR) repeat protein
MLFRVTLLASLLSSSVFCFGQLPSAGSGAPAMPGYSSPNDPSGQMNQMGRSWNSTMRSQNAIIGSVRAGDNQPLTNVRVELRDASTGVVVASSFTGAAGSFEFRQLQQGSYDVVAMSGTTRSEERVQLSSMTTSIDIRLPVSNSPTDGIRGNTVSVNQYRIPESARNEMRKAEEAAAKGKGEETLKHLDRALEIQPSYANALSLRAAIKLDREDVQGAVADAQKAIDSDGNYGMAYTVMGSALNLQGKYDDALRSLQRAETLSPDMWQVYFEMGRAYAGKKDYPASLQALDHAQRLSPTQQLIPLIRAFCLMQLGRSSEAVTELQGYLTHNPKGSKVEDAKKMLVRAQASQASASN